MFPISSHITCVCSGPGVYRLYYQNRGVGEAISVDTDALYVSHSAIASGRVVASLRDAARWIEQIEDAIAAPRTAA